MQKLLQESVGKILDDCYDKAVQGVPLLSPSAEEFALECMQKYPTAEKACKAMIKNQITKCAASGFVTGLGGFASLPVALPANITSVLYFQMRMIACTAYMAGYDLNSDETQTFVYACLAGISVNKILKQIGVDLGMKLSTGLIKKIPGKALTKINQRVGFRFITKFGQKGLINLGKLVPVAGGLIGGGFDLAETKLIGNRAYKWFFEGECVYDEKAEAEVEEFEILSAQAEAAEALTEVE